MRLEDWEQRLGDYLAECRDYPFEWGQHDCALYAYGAATAVTGEDKAAAYRGRYSDKAGSALALRELGKGTLLKTVNADYPAKPVAFAQRGDLVWFDGAIGVCMGADALFVGEERLFEKAGIPVRTGLVTIPRRLWERAWGV